MKKIFGAATAALLTVTALAGCGGSSSSASGGYCDDIKSATQDLKGLGSASTFTGDNFTTVFTAVHKIAGEAPSDIKPSWTLIDKQFGFLKSALASAGVSMDDFSKLANGQTPAGLDPAKLSGLTTKLQQFDTAGLSAASTKIQTQVKADCKVDLNSASN